MIVKVRRIEAYWLLTIEDDSKVYNSWSSMRLIEVLRVACTLQLHVSNLNDFTFETMSEATKYMEAA